MDSALNNTFSRNHFCRVCLKETPNLTYMEKPFKNHQETLLKVFNTITKIELNTQDSLCTLLCEDCLQRLNDSHSFIKQAQASNDVLTRYIASVRLDKVEGHTEPHETLRKVVGIEDVSQAIHELTRSFLQSVSCRKCTFRCSNSRSLSIHMNHVHPESHGRWCSHCNDEVTNLPEHLDTHVNLTCRFCNKKFRRKNHLKEHLLGHLDEKTFTCDSCGNSFLTSRQLQAHCKVHNDFSGRIEKGIECKLCSYCGKQFKTAAKLALHMRVHTGETPYECRLCERKFTSRSHLVLHERIHTGEKTNVCHICGKSFLQSSVLNTHLKLHLGRPNTCKICGQKFCRPAQLQIHMRKHTGEKPYVCKTCRQAFVQRSHLTQHERIHTGARPFSCTHCNRSFSQKSTLTAHLHIHSGSKPFECDLCSYACRQSYGLQMHKKKHTNGDIVL